MNTKIKVGKLKVVNRKADFVICGNCGTKFLKSIDQILRSNKKNTGHYCSLKCVSIHAINTKLGETIGFGFYTNLARQRAKIKKIDFDLSSEYLKELFTLQNGKCAITQIPVVLNKSAFKGKDKRMDYASLDRIDSSKGYVKGNVQFVCLGINYMKNTFSSEDISSFLIKLKN